MGYIIVFIFSGLSACTERDTESMSERYGQKN